MSILIYKGSKMYANILTGGIGCGKSTAATLLTLHGFRIIDADKISHSSLDLAKECVIESFGNDILKDDKSDIDRAKLGNIVFQDLDKKAKLESILHPMIRQRIMEECAILEARKSPFFIDIPLYFESKHKYPARFVICVYATRDMQLERIQKRNDLKICEAIKRVDSQIDIEIKKAKSDFVIDNTGDLKLLQKNIESFLQEFLKHYE